MPEQPILEVRGLTREFVRRGKPFPAVDDVNLTLDPGEFMAIVGRSGNGKSTLLNLVTGLLKPTSGSILLAGNEVTTLNDKQMSILRNRTIGFVTQIQTLLPNLTAIDNVVLPAVLHRNPSRYETEIDERTNDAQSQEQTASSVVVDGLPDVIQPASTQTASSSQPGHLTQRAQHLLDQLLVGELATCYPKELSGGEMRRVSIARALMNKPKLLIADEPTTALDVTIQAQILQLLKQLNENEQMNIILITHDLGVVASLAKRIEVMYGGLIMEEGTTEEIFEHPTHPYTRALLHAIPKCESGCRERLEPIPGMAPSLANPPAGCPFVTRCRFACEECKKGIPSMRAYSDTQSSRCIFTKEELDEKEKKEEEK